MLNSEACEVPVVHALQQALVLSKVRSKPVVTVILLVTTDTAPAENEHELLEHLGVIYMQLGHMR